MASILIVEDAPDVCEPLQAFLIDSGHVVRCVRNGREALTHVLGEMPDVVVLDLHTPEMDGPTFLEVVRSYLRLQSLPVVVLTGLDDSPLVERAMKFRVKTVLLKGKTSYREIERAIDAAIGNAPM